MTPYAAIKAAQHVATEAKSEAENIIVAQVSDQWTLPDPSDPVHFFADWNGKRSWKKGFGYAYHEGQTIDNTMSRLMNILEHMGHELEWNDEWTMCDDCGRMFHTSPDCWDWRQFGWFADDCTAICGNCVREDPDEYLAAHLNNPRATVNTDIIDLTTLGFENLNGSFENGLHPGQNADPAKVLADFQQSHPDHEFLFDYSPSQFYVSFQIWGRPKTEDDD